MRFVPIEQVEEGMIIAQTIFGVNGEIMVKAGMPIKARTLEKLKDYYMEYLYINDELSKDVQIKCTISSEMRNEAVQNMKALYEAINRNKNEEVFSTPHGKVLHEKMQACLTSVDKIMEDTITEKITLVDVFDVKLLENYNYAHSVNVCLISIVLGKALGLNGYDLYKLGIGAFFHDMGQMFMPQELLDKEGQYDDSDIQTMRQHPEIGYRFAKDHFNLPTTSYLAILQHHERHDGSGYPHGKAGEDISLYGRIVAIADVFDALTSIKKYRPAMLPVAAFKYLIANAGTAFDPKLVKLFIEKVSPYPIGFTLKLDQDTEGIVVRNYENNPLHPKVRIYKSKGVMVERPFIKTL